MTSWSMGRRSMTSGRKLDDAAERGGEDGGEDEAVVEPAVGFVVAAGAVGLGEEGVEREQDAGDAEGEGVVEDLTERGGGDVDGRVGHVADHDGVDDAHGHPAELGGDEREGEGEDGADLLADGHAGTPPPLFAQSLQSARLSLDFATHVPGHYAWGPERKKSPDEPGAFLSLFLL